MNEYGFIRLRFFVLLTVARPENVTCVFLISRRGFRAVGACVFSGLAPDCRWAASICDEEVTGWLGLQGAVQGAARWSIIYYRTSLRLLGVTNALRRDGVPEVNAALLTPTPSDKHCQCSNPKGSDVS